MMKKKIVLVCLIFLVFIFWGCEQSKSTDTVEGNSSIVEKAIEQGKLALADADMEKAKSNFNLALKEDKDNEEAKEWLELIEKFDRFVSKVEEKEIDSANDILNTLKKNENYSIIEGLMQPHEKKLDKMIAGIEELDQQIAELKKLYDPQDENSMPSEDYLVRADKIIANPSITKEQKEDVQRFKKDASERAKKILALEAEKQRIAEQEIQEKYDPYEWAPNVKEQFEQDIFKRGYVDSIESIRYEKAGVYNNQGRMEVFGEMDGQEFRIVNVNVKTGDYHG